MEQVLRFAWSAGTPRSVGRSWVETLSCVYPSCRDLHDLSRHMHIDLMFTMANPQDVHKQSKARLDDGHWLASECPLPQGV